MLASTNRSADRARRLEIRIVPAYTWLCQFVQALLANGINKIDCPLRFLPIKVAFRDCFRHKLKQRPNRTAAAVSKWFGKTHDDSL